MEKIIFFAIAFPILGFVFYLGGAAIMKGFKAKVDNRAEEVEENENQEQSQNFSNENDQLSSELNKLNELLKSGILTQDEFEKAKKKILDN
jgi:membrane protease subunit (stomatin/prohibitin family)